MAQQFNPQRDGVENLQGRQVYHVVQQVAHAKPVAQHHPMFYGMKTMKLYNTGTNELIVLIFYNSLITYFKNTMTNICRQSGKPKAHTGELYATSSYIK